MYRDFSKIRKHLAELYPDASRARRVADDAGLDTDDINFGGSATEIWHNVLHQAASEDAVWDVVQVAVDDYSGNSEWLLAALTYRHDSDFYQQVTEPVSDNSSILNRLDRLEGSSLEHEKRISKLEVFSQVQDMFQQRSSTQAPPVYLLLSFALVVALSMVIVYLMAGGAPW